MLKLSPLPVAEWPELDQQLWAKARRKAHKLDDPGWAGELRPASIVIAETGYGFWLRWLASSAPLSLEDRPGARLSRSLVVDFAESYLEGRAGNTVNQALRGLHRAVRAMEERHDFRWVDRLARHYAAMPKVKNKQTRVVPVSELYRFGLDLMERNATDRPLTPFAAYKFRDGLMIGLLAAHPDRLRNFHDLRLGATLIRDKSGYHVTHQSSEMKDHQDRAYSVMDSLTTWLDHYVDVVRPALLKSTPPEDDTGHLWISQHGTPMKPGSISTRVSKLTKAEFGRTIPPHMFRDCAATSIALEDPEHVWITMPVLGHAGPSMAERAYNQASQLSASKRFSRGLAGLRHRLKRRLD